jgi:protein-L-isoaspartate(D-aspartate) O-methyltransferase
MAWLSSGTTNKDLVENLWKNDLITQEVVRDAFLKVRLRKLSPPFPQRPT